MQDKKTLGKNKKLYSPRKKLVLDVVRVGANLEGVCKTEDPSTGIAGMAVFVPGVLPGETIEVEITKSTKSYASGQLVKILNKSDARRNPKCKQFGKCGGCSAQHMTYEDSLKYKRNNVINCIERIGGIADPTVLDTIGMELPFNYRNKGQFPALSTSKGAVIGNFAQGSHYVVNLKSCMLQHDSSNRSITILRDYMDRYDVEGYEGHTHTGIIRHLVTRVARNGDVMVIIVTRGEDLPFEQELIEAFQEGLPHLVSIVHNINNEVTTEVMGPDCYTIWGSDILKDEILGLSFEISAQSFFQVNPEQTDKLYSVALEYADLNGKETVVDAYCGAGTISLLMAIHAKKVIGIEIVEQAVNDATRNAEANNIKNVEFICGAAEILLPELADEGSPIDVVVVDPPRKGCDNELLDAILQILPPRVVYVSCNPATMARDLKKLCSDGYKLVKVQPVDMFCWTSEIECVALLTPVDSE